MIKIRELYSYPVKSCAGIQHDHTRISNFGLEGDRQWMLVDEQGMMITQRKLANMCLVQVEYYSHGIKLTAAGEYLEVAVPANGSRRAVMVWNDKCQALDAGDKAAVWLSAFLQKDCRLVYFPPDEFRQVDMDYARAGDKTAFSDGFPVLLISQASLDDLNSRLQQPVSIKRFRPNIVVEGCEAFVEDGWKEIKIGEITFRVVKPCSRCIIPSINPETAEREPELLQILKSYRQRGNKVFFGQNVIPDYPVDTLSSDSQLVIETGMPVTLIK